MSDSSSDTSASRDPAREAEFVDFHTKIFRKVSNYVTRHSRRMVEGDDIASEALLDMYKSWDTIPAGHRNATVYAIAHNKMVDEIRKTKSRRKNDRLYQNSKRTSYPEPGQRFEVLQTLAAIDQLPRRQRQAMLLHFDEGLSEEDIAEVMGLDVLSVRVTLSRARNRITKIVGNAERRQRRQRRQLSAATNPNPTGVTTEGRTP